MKPCSASVASASRSGAVQSSPAPFSVRSSSAATSSLTTTCASLKVFIRNTSRRSGNGTETLKIDGCIPTPGPAVYRPHKYNRGAHPAVQRLFHRSTPRDLAAFLTSRSGTKPCKTVNYGRGVLDGRRSGLDAPGRPNRPIYWLRRLTGWLADLDQAPLSLRASSRMSSWPILCFSVLSGMPRNRAVADTFQSLRSSARMMKLREKVSSASW